MAIINSVTPKTVSSLYNRTITKFNNEAQRFYIEHEVNVAGSAKKNSVATFCKSLYEKMSNTLKNIVSKHKKPEAIKFLGMHDAPVGIPYKHLKLEHQVPYREAMLQKAVDFTREVVPDNRGLTELITENYTFKNGNKVTLKFNSRVGDFSNAILQEKTVHKGDSILTTTYEYFPNFHIGKEVFVVDGGEKKLVQTKLFDDSGKLTRVILNQFDKKTIIDRNIPLNAVGVRVKDAHGNLIDSYAQRNGKYIDIEDFDILSEALASKNKVKK